MKTETNEQKPQLLAVLREAVGIVQMILFKEIRNNLAKKRPGFDSVHLSMLAGSITNEVFGTRNPEEKFARFRTEHRADIEQELLSLKNEMPKLCENITDALRIQTLCDRQEGVDSSQTLALAKDFGILVEDREVPLPSFFMTQIRELGEEHKLVVPPAQITPAQDNVIVH
ncbi:MAG: hypothetical protein VR65_25650 [Desulfobulbaceae bacterium BRH_c16a]|nr:MAG: hypothetical protein VR65_25650 [Desulfobulbaceae bacterium BRH_c16a]